MKPYLIDVPVLFIIFARPYQTEKVFEQIKKARPSKLYIYQDGPRSGRDDDQLKIEECRKIINEIDWNCEVYKKFQNENFGCDPSEYIAQKWMFEKEEYGIILEDDDVPSQSFFNFCKELLIKYKDDDRICMISGMNNLGEYNLSTDSYIFSSTGSIWGWATWKRIVDEWDENYSFLDNKEVLKLLRNKMGSNKFKTIINTARQHRVTNKAHYESILGASRYLGSRLNIIPTKNMISNIGIGVESTHSVSSLKFLPISIRKVMNMKTYEIEFPLVHPKYIIEDVKYREKLDRLMGNSYTLLKFFRSLESIFYRIIYGDFKSLRKGIKRRLNK